MKTKLLRKVRKRFEIYYNPNGVRIGGSQYEDQFYLEDKTDSWLCRILKTRQECLDLILRRVRNEYYRYTRKHKPNQKIWYKND